MDQKTAIMLFSDDFRTNDNAALYNIVKNYDSVILLYIYDENYLGRPLGAASKVFLYYTLESFRNFLKEQYNAELILRKGEVIEVIEEIIKEAPVKGIYFNHSYTLEEQKKERLIKAKFISLDIQSFKAKLIFDPWEVMRKSDKGHFRVFSPFLKECYNHFENISELLPGPESIYYFRGIQGVGLSDLGLLPEDEGNWHIQMAKYWVFDYKIIKENFSDFIQNRLKNYRTGRRSLSKNGSSRISPYLRFGVLSPRECMEDASAASTSSSNKFISELLWREFAYHVMFYNPDMATLELKSKYKCFKYDNSKIFLQKWQSGRTGFDIVDAGMNELYITGVMHNRVRMITASFLIKDLLVDWRLGEQWFWDTLVDADPAVNPFSWQWVSGSGFDRVPGFRIFNPHLQKEKFDPKSEYCKKWLPQNWKARKIVDHATQRKIALERFKIMNLSS